VSIGDGSVQFRVLDVHTGKYVYYLAVHVKVDGETGRTVFFKELSFDENGDIVPLEDGGSNPVTNVLKFRVSATGACCGLDFDGSGIVDVPDINGYLSHFFASDAEGDFDRNGVVEVPDIFTFLSRWSACTGS